MNRLPLVWFAVSLGLAAGCSGTSGANLFTYNQVPPPNNAPATPQPTSGSPSPPPSSNVQITEYPTSDTLLTGLTIASDANVYAAATTGLDIFSPATGTFESQLRSTFRPQTWPVIANVSSAPTGPVTSSGPTVDALGAATPSSGAIRPARSVAPVTPFLATYTIASKTFTEAFGNAGDLFEDVAQSPDGAAWITADRATPSGLQGYIFTTKAGCSQPAFTDAIDSITLGADKFIWFASDPRLNSASPSQIFRLEPSSGTVVNTYTLPAGSIVASMTAGPDGALWFADVGLNEIGRLGSNGAVSYFAIPTAQAGLVGISTGCDGALWFTERAANKVGRMTTSGAASEYAVPTANAGLGEIVGCLRGALYFTETHAIGKLTETVY